ncbi:DUF4097 family beta strand repeat-containing protein [Salipaludibacillus daqingensis]|uniref:DUF4097 family beta strand repeat-containing protein n=1 Tax=Salipaludibacillus daqingensis TaxID=3041001 RepID=UPI002475F7F8|nr:DUF4097 family beta strand repeat-containing protein [Salipaludibacillus daqingensis]
MSKIGRKTLGLLLLLVGGIFLVQQWSSFSFTGIFGFIWPIIFVGIVIEMIFYYRSKEPGESFQFDKGAMVILIMTIVVSASMQNLQQSGTNIIYGFSFMDWEDSGVSVPIEESYDLSNEVDEIHFDMPNARLRIEGTDEEQVSLSGTVKANKNSESEVEKLFNKSRKVETKGNEFQYIVERTDSSWFFWSNNVNVEFVISIPRDRLVDVKITNGSVDVLNVDEDVDVKTTNGRVTIESVEGNVDVRNTNGIVSLRDIAGEVEAITTNGRVSATNLASDVSLKTTNGAVEVESNQVNGDWDLETTNGNVTLRIPQDSDVFFQGKTTNGSVDGDLDWVREDEDNFLKMNNEGSATHNAGTYKMEAKGTNGSIRVSFIQ